MCIHHFTYDPICNYLTPNPFFNSISHCDFVKKSLDYYHSQGRRKPFLLFSTLEHKPKTLRMPQACPFTWELEEGQEPPEIGAWKLPPWKIQENADFLQEIRRRRGRGRGEGRGRGRRRGGPRMLHPWGRDDEQGGGEMEIPHGMGIVSISRRIGWPEDEHCHLHAPLAIRHIHTRLRWLRLRLRWFGFQEPLKAHSPASFWVAKFQPQTPRLSHCRLAHSHTTPSLHLSPSRLPPLSPLLPPPPYLPACLHHPLAPLQATQSPFPRPTPTLSGRATFHGLQEDSPRTSIRE